MIGLVIQSEEAADTFALDNGVTCVGNYAFRCDDNKNLNYSSAYSEFCIAPVHWRTNTI